MVVKWSKCSVSIASARTTIEPDELARGEKAREPLGVLAQWLVSRQCWVDWPAQPYLKPEQTI